jgi:hypothetical protein
VDEWEDVKFGMIDSPPICSNAPFSRSLSGAFNVTCLSPLQTGHMHDDHDAGEPCDNHQAIGGFRDIDITQDHRQK